MDPLTFVGLSIFYTANSIYSGINVTAQPYNLPWPPAAVGPLAPNNILETNSVKLLNGKVVGPESLIVEGDTIYASLYDGRVVKIQNETIVKEIRFTKASPCGSYDTEPKCGRPLGIRRLNAQQILVADSYLGVYTVNFDTGKFKKIVPITKRVEGKSFKFLNDLDVLNEDEFIFTDSSYRWDRRRFMNIILQQAGDGRVLKHKISTGKTTVIASGLNFPNGVQLTSDKKFVLISECSMSRIKKIDLTTLAVTTFIENLPGYPDNIRSADDGTFWVGLAVSRFEDRPTPFDLMGSQNYTNTRQYLVDNVPGQLWTPVFGQVAKPPGIIAQLDSNGNILRTLQDQSGKTVGDASQINAVGNTLYLGSFHATSIVKVTL